MSVAKAVAAGLIVRQQQVLVCRRSLSGSHPGKFEFPGGKQEPGETIAQCLRRELREELGVEVAVGDEIWRTRHGYGAGREFELVFLAVTAVAGTIVNRVFESIHWTPLAELPGLDFLEADRELVARLARGEFRLAESSFARE